MRTVTGRVVEFDERRGLGAVEPTTACATRSTAPPSPTAPARSRATPRVEFTLVPGPVGRFEAGAIRAVG